MYCGVMARYSILDHTADTGIEAHATSLAGLIEALATGMFALVAEDLAGSHGTARIEVSADNETDLVYEALSELLYRSELDGLAFHRFEVALEDERKLKISATGARLDQLQLTGPPIKAVTYHDMSVSQNSDGWHGRVYFDV